MLAYLLLNRDRSHGRGQLAGRFWGDRPEQKARSSLSTALWHIRRTLPDEGLILSDAHTVQVEPGPDLWLDVEAFTAQASSEDIPRLEAAVALCRGEFMRGFYDDWVISERYRLQTLYGQALERLMAGYEMGGDHQAVLTAAQRLLEQNPLREEAHRATMRAYCRLGRRSAALEQYGRCRKLLREELGAEPMAETRELYEGIRSGRLAVGPVDGAVPGPAPVALSAAAGCDPLDAVASSPLVGREAEMAFLKEQWSRAQAEQGGLVLLSGLAGVGKTRLANEFADWLRWRGGRVLWGRCYEFERLLPYQPVAEALRSVLPALNGAELAELPGWVLAEVSRLVPEVVEKWPNLEIFPPVGPSQDPARLFDGLARFLGELASQSALCIVLEDLHWATESTVGLLHHLARQAVGRPLFILGTYRPEALDRKHPLRAVRRQLLREGVARSLSLPPLLPEAVEAMVREMSGAGDVVQPLARRIYRETEGNPFFVIEIVKALFQMGMVHLEGGVWQGDFARIGETRLPLPFSVSELIEARVGRLSEGAQEALRLASILGREFDFGPLQTAGGWSVDETLDAVDVLLRQRLIEEGGRGATGRDYAFTHHKICEVVLAGMEPRRRGRLHAQVGEAIERLHGAELETVAAELAHHFLEAGELEPALTEKAVAYLTLAGEAAAGVRALAEARAYYARALEALEGLPDTEENRARRFDALLNTIASTWRSDVARCLPHLEEAERLMEGLPDPEGVRRAQLYFSMGRVHYALGKAREAIGHYRQVLPVAKKLDDPELLAVPSSAIGQTLAIRGLLGQAEPLLREAISLFEGLGNWSEWIRATGFHGWTLAGMGESEAEVGIAWAERALARAKELNYPSEIGLSYANLAQACLFASDPSRAREMAEGMVEAGERSGDRAYCSIGWGYRSWAEARAGRYQEAAASIAQQRAIRGELGRQIVLDDYFAAVNAEVALGAGRFREALELAEGAVGVARAFGGLFSEAWARRVWGQALAALAPPRWEEAEAQLAESVRLLESGQVRLWVARTRVAWGVISRDRGDPAAAREHWEQAAAQFERSGLTDELDQVRGLLEALG